MGDFRAQKTQMLTACKRECIQEPWIEVSVYKYSLIRPRKIIPVLYARDSYLCINYIFPVTNYTTSVGYLECNLTVFKKKQLGQKIPCTNLNYW